MKKIFKSHKNFIKQAVKNSIKYNNETSRILNELAEEELKKDFLKWAEFKIKTSN